MTAATRRTVISWSVRLLLGVALGWGVRLVYERRPLVRFAAGMAVRSVRDGEELAGTRGAHVRNGQPYFFSLDQIMAADDPAAALRAWREAFQKAPREIQQKALQARAEVSIGALRELLLRFAASAALRDEMNALLEIARDLGADLYDPDASLRTLVELARLDPGLALDGAQAIEHDDAQRMVWAVIAEENPQRVIELVQAGQAPPEAMGMAMASLAATDLEKASELFLTLPDDKQGQVVNIFADVLARTRPLEALAMQPGPDGKADPNWAEEIIRKVPGPQALDFLLGLERQHPELLESCARDIGGLLARQAQREPGFVFEWLERQDPAAAINMHSDTRMFPALVAHDPVRAAALAQQFPQGRMADMVQSAVADAWMRRDPMAAIEWMTAQPESQTWLGAVNWHEAVAPEQAPAVARALADQGISPGAVVSPWMKHDPESAMDWAIQLPEGPDRAHALYQVAENLTQDQPPGAQEFIQKLIAASPDALPHLVNRADPRRLPLGQSVAEALPQLLDQAASAKVQLTAVARHLSASIENPARRQEAMGAIAALPDPAQRQQLLNQVVAGEGARSFSLPLARQLAAAMPDADAARQFLENTVRQRFHR